MRRWFILLMIALLPIRGWVGDAMAADMLTQRLHTLAPVQAATTQPADAHADCHGKTVAHNPAQPVAGNAPDIADCGSCASCQVCHSLVLAAASGTASAVSAPHAAPPVRGTHFASAEPTRGFKPPIS
jgi:hypothetical protein